MILNGKMESNWLWSTRVQFSFHINRSIQYSYLILNKTFLLLFQVFFVVAFEYCSLEVVDYTKCELIGGVFPR